MCLNLSINFIKALNACVHIYPINNIRNCFLVIECNTFIYIFIYLALFTYLKLRVSEEHLKEAETTFLTLNSSCPIRSHQLLRRWLATHPTVTGRCYVYSRKLRRSSSAVSHSHGGSLRTGEKLRSEMNAMTWTKPRNYPSQTQNQPHWAVQHGFRNYFKDNKTPASSLPQEASASGDHRRIREVNR